MILSKQLVNPIIFKRVFYEDMCGLANIAEGYILERLGRRYERFDSIA